MTKFKAGDKVRMLSDRYWGGHVSKFFKTGDICSIYEDQEFCSSDEVRVACKNGYCSMVKISDIELVNNLTPNSMSSLKDRVKALAKTEPEKSLYKAGFTDINDELTEEGRAILDDIIFEEKKVKLAEIAKKIIKENKEKDV